MNPASIYDSCRGKMITRNVRQGRAPAPPQKTHRRKLRLVWNALLSRKGAEEFRPRLNGAKLRNFWTICCPEPEGTGELRPRFEPREGKAGRLTYDVGKPSRLCLASCPNRPRPRRRPSFSIGDRGSLLGGKKHE